MSRNLTAEPAAEVAAALALAARWGLNYPCDPGQRSGEGVVLWDPNVLPTAIILAAAPGEWASPLSFAELPASSLAIDRPDGRHLLLREPGGDTQLWIIEAPPTAPIAAIIPFDRNLPQRLEATLQFWQRLTGLQPQPIAPLTIQQRRRLILMLRALDGWQQRTSYRELAAILLDPGVRQQHHREWLTSPRRAQIIRLVRDALRRMRGGYRDLLRGL